MKIAPQLLSIIILLLLISTSRSNAQSKLVDSLAQDTIIIDDKQSTFGQNIQWPKSTLKPEEYSSFINKEFSASAVLKTNRQFTKVVVAMIVEKDGSVSTCTVKGVGPTAMKEELVRIIKLFPKSIPGTKDGKPIRFRLYQPFEFSYVNN